jgi:polyisoprenoid-binding protein YceI
VLEFRGGIEEWMAAGGAVEGQAASPTGDPGVAEGRREIDPGESRLEWIGRNLLNRHHGTLAIGAGHLDFSDGLPSGGEFVFDMNAIACTNLAGDPLHDVLVNHLRSDDFFDTEVHPEARFRVLSARRVGDGGAGKPNLRIEGELTLKGKTLPLVLDAVAGFTPDGRPAAQAVLAFDRTLWNVIYGSARFFRNLGMHLVNDLIEVHLRIVVKEPGSG